jgi:hypothetical protein
VVEGFNQERRGLFDGLKVPFDVNAIILAAVGVLAFLVGVWVIEAIAEMPEGHGQLLPAIAYTLASKAIGGETWARITHALEIEPPKATLVSAHWLTVLTWGSVVWAFFSGAICRIAAMKIAREEGLEIKDALKFAASKFVPNLLSIVFVVAIVGFFYVICNATIAGWVGRIPYVGEVLVAILYFLVLLSSFFIVFAGVLGVLGFNLAAAAIATEASDTFDGVSRAWNYILARPWQVILTYGLTFTYMAIFFFCAHAFEKVATKSLSVGWWGMGAKTYTDTVDKELAEAIGNIEPGQAIALPGKGEFLYHRLVLRDKVFNETDATGNDVLYYPQFETDTQGNRKALINKKTQTYLEAPDAKDHPEHTNRLNVWPAIPASLRAASTIISGWLYLAKFLIWGYLASYFLCAMTKIYFLLRKDVEGDDYTEINLEEDEDEDEGFDYGETQKSGPTKPEEKKSLPIVTTGTSPAPPASAEKKDEHKH